MILLLDLGNTNLNVGVYHLDQLVCEFRTHSDLNKSKDEYKSIISNFLIDNKIDSSLIEGAIFSSVVPSLSRTITKAVKELINKEVKVIGQNLKTGLSIRIDNPNELGADLVCDSVGAKIKYKCPLIIVDLGTANKILVIDKDGNFVGCTISSGITLSMKMLSSSTAQLMDTSLIAPKKVIGKNSSDSLNSGFIYGTVASIEGLSNMIEDELGYHCNKVLTGGNSELVKDYISNEYIYDPYLIFDGLNYIYNKNR